MLSQDGTRSADLHEVSTQQTSRKALGMLSKVLKARTGRHLIYVLEKPFWLRWRAGWEEA